MAVHTLEKSRLIVDVLIPALNEESAVGAVVSSLIPLFGFSSAQFYHC